MNYKGVKTVHLIKVTEGDGSPDFPFQTIEYVVENAPNGQMITIGRLAYLGENERQFINN